MIGPRFTEQFEMMKQATCKGANGCATTFNAVPPFAVLPGRSPGCKLGPPVRLITGPHETREGRPCPYT